MGPWTRANTGAHSPRRLGAYGTTAAAGTALLLALAGCTAGGSASAPESSVGGPSAGSGPTSAVSPSAPTSGAPTSAPGLTAPAEPLGPATASPSVPPTGTPGNAATTTSSLTITLLATPTATPVSYTLLCDGAAVGPTSTLPNAATACAELEAHGEEVLDSQRPMPEQCTQQYGGPQQATVTGTFHGRSIDASFSLTDGCRIAVWNSIPTLLGGPAGSN
jgi:hypothetical protein